MAHFYLNPELTDARVGDTVTLVGSEARHAVTVGRLRAGESISVGNGAGLIAVGRVLSAGPDRVDIEVATSSVELRPRREIWLAQALAKGDRDELAIQAATELGVDGVIPWAAERCVVRWEGAKALKHEARWASILREASKQSMRHYIPRLQSLMATDALAKFASDRILLVLEPTATQGISSVTKSLLSGDQDLLLVVGPEGGIAPAELARFASAGASAISLGNTVLRTSTAGPAAVAVLSHLLGRW